MVDADPVADAMDFLALAYLPYRDFRLWMDTRTHAISQRS
jgi:hypothetical protein